MKKVKIFSLFALLLLLACCVLCGCDADANSADCVHEFGEYTQTLAPECAKAGEESATCALCGATDVRSIAPLGHDTVEHAAKAPECLTPGWDAYESCSRCDYTTYKEIPPKGHSEGTQAAVPPTLDSTGLSEGKYCTDCNAVFVKQTVLDKLYLFTAATSNADLGKTDVTAQGYASGMQVTVTATPEEGKYFFGWLENGVLVSREAVYTFVMPKAQFALTAYFVEEAIGGGQTDVWDGSVAEAFAGGKGTAAEPYLISTGAQLAFLSQKFSDAMNPYYSSHFRLVNSIDLNGLAWKPIGPSDRSSNGDYDSTRFRGSFDGNGNTISNFVINDEGLMGYTGSAIGLFGVMKNATVKDLTVSNVTVILSNSSSHYFGGLVGTAENTTVINCAVEGLTVNYTAGNGAKIGGIAAQMSANCTVERCSAEINASLVCGAVPANMAGLVAVANKCVIRNCYATGSLEASVTVAPNSPVYVGGVTSSASNGTEISCCYSNMSLSAISPTELSSAGDVYMGGITAYASNITLSQNLVLGDLSVSHALLMKMRVGPVIGFDFGYNTESEGNRLITTLSLTQNGEESFGSGWFDSVTPEQLSAAAFYLDTMRWDPNVWALTSLDATNGQFPVQSAGRLSFIVVGVESGEGGKATHSGSVLTAGQSITLTATPDSGYRFVGWYIGDELLSALATYTYTPTANVGVEARFEERGTEADVWDGSLASAFDGGDGSEQSPYQIATGAQLAYLASVINGSDDNPLYDKHFVLVSDIDLNGLEWDPIGCQYYGNDYSSYSASRTFRGVFDGNGHTVSKAKISQFAFNFDRYFGLFGYVNGGTVKDLTLSGFNVSLAHTTKDAYVGGLAGCTANATISNCHVDFAVSGNAAMALYVGGLIGRSYKSAISDCSATGAVTAASPTSDSRFNTSAYAGGLIGYMDEATSVLERCYSTGTVTLTSALGGCSAGGLLGYAKGQVSDCYATGDVVVTVSGSYNSLTAGGFAAWAQQGSNFTRCYATGSVTATMNGSTPLVQAAAFIGTGDITNTSAAGKIQYCYATGNVTASSKNGNAYAGGITTSLQGAEILNCYTTGNVQVTSVSGEVKASALATSLSGAYKINNCYAMGNVSVTTTGKVEMGDILATTGIYDGNGNMQTQIARLSNNYYYGEATLTASNQAATITRFATACTQQQLADAAFFTETLGWSADVFDFSGIATAPGKPQLRSADQ